VSPRCSSSVCDGVTYSSSRIVMISNSSPSMQTKPFSTRNAVQEVSPAQAPRGDGPRAGGFPEAYDIPLTREFFGLPPRTEARTARFSSRHDDDLPVVDYSEGYIGRPGQSDYVPTPYGPEARRAAEEAERPWPTSWTMASPGRTSPVWSARFGAGS
jgi:hypothetical protein